ncbi:MAG: hypothetical protein JGK24_28625 [Microcoleus sp. PH2017_29_MFU_D_A]|uniref:hypothetical protein n=1 Tax=unclassified Microcoleus TaxID=2642155 RepID=UPI001DDD3E41|nr:MULTISPECIES: hypothetical protein [unclassified Microcoleus]MCC3419480.1 hypothetical protein [Microcoleus sp. PH2017_07_MST_O_A]MCC3431082.1 hypothetical protein [Microcoleus sp. PH2017_04_SCI_O_A]MCC3444215.1 hypothetical protein [Microcoleus sp. PH2017_03_ELD_O_A]MCC3466774.1 hypothetical protein [Microcoleus sp. PH2017_06_SFM_O_A]MCC3505671.1 hypothetical protein [Microcoleus sp. PH2017_19_SFW_U_A]MCC3513121.1 hypothetical protein [Microcoleus sp. PH2017_17_BER_D_A]
MKNWIIEELKNWEQSSDMRVCSMGPAVAFCLKIAITANCLPQDVESSATDFTKD